MTREQMKKVLAAARLSEADRAVLMRRALAGEAEARFVVLALSRKVVVKP